MKEIKKEITTEQIVYEITKEELEKIKRDERTKGRCDIMGYIGFSAKYYCKELNIRGTIDLSKDIISFVAGVTNVIENIYGYSFKEYVDEYIGE